jgi:divalent metal cation (Fe/Co/Zn/Cd) transporter
MLGIIPPASFLIASKVIQIRPNKNFAYGFHKTVGIAFLSSSLALFILGLFLLLDGLRVLIAQHHPKILTITILNQTIWQGYIMILALLWSSVPSTILGHIKISLSKKLYDKILYADAKMNKASWMSGFASIVGIVGIGLGYWWADALIGMIISINIIYDGYNNTKQAILDLINEIPKTIDETKTDPLLMEIRELIKNEKWVKSFQLRFRDDGHVFFGEIFIEPKENPLDIIKIMRLQTKIQKYHWRLLDIVIMPIIKEFNSSK